MPDAKVIEHPAARARRLEEQRDSLAGALGDLVDAIQWEYRGKVMPGALAAACETSGQARRKADVMASPADVDVQAADKLAGIEGAVARRDAIAEALSEVRQAAFREGLAMSPRRTVETVAHVSPWDMFAAAALGQLIGELDEDADEDDVEGVLEGAVAYANDMMKLREKLSEKGRNG